jgi:hypothetical protein
MNDILDTGRTTDWDYDIFTSLYTESAIDMLRTTHYDVAALLLADLDQRVFVTWINELATEHDCEPSDILRSVSRTLHAALRA